MRLSIAFKEKDFHHSIPLYLFFIFPQSLFAVSLHCFSLCESLASNTLFYPQKCFAMIFSKDPNNFLLEFLSFHPFYPSLQHSWKTIFMKLVTLQSHANPKRGQFWQNLIQIFLLSWLKKLKVGNLFNSLIWVSNWNVRQTEKICMFYPF